MRLTLKILTCPSDVSIISQCNQLSVARFKSRPRLFCVMQQSYLSVDDCYFPGINVWLYTVSTPRVIVPILLSIACDRHFSGHLELSFFDFAAATHMFQYFTEQLIQELVAR